MLGGWIPSFASITQVQGVGSTALLCSNTTTTSCTSGTLAAVGAGHLIVVEHFNAGTSGTGVTTAVCGGDTLTNISGASQVTANGSISLWYILSASGGATTCQLTMSVTATGRGMVVYEYSSSLTSPTFTLDTGTTPSAATFTSGACTNCVGVTLVTAGANDVIVQAFVGGVATAVSSPWNSLVEFQGAVGRYATANLNTAVGTPPTYTNASTSTTYVNGAAFTENGSGGGGGFIANQSVFAVGP